MVRTNTGCMSRHLVSGAHGARCCISLLLMSNEAAVSAWCDLSKEPASSRLLMYFQTASFPTFLSTCVLLFLAYMSAYFGCWVLFSFLRRRWLWRWRISFALASWMHIVFLLKPYSSLWDLEGFAHGDAWNLIFPLKCHVAQNSRFIKNNNYIRYI